MENLRIKEGLRDFRELVSLYRNEYKEKIAFRFRKEVDNVESNLIDKTYLEFAEDIKYLATKFIDMGLKNSKISIIGPNSYKWCVTYLAVTTSEMTVVPLDRALPENEVVSLLNRAKVETLVYDKKNALIIEKIKSEGTTTVKHFICMENEYNECLEAGKKLYEGGMKEYDNIVLDPHAVSIILFTSGTTSLAKGVMLSQDNICQDIATINEYMYIDSNDTFLSILPLHHTLESSVTFIFGTSKGITICICDGMKYIAQNFIDFGITVFLGVPALVEMMHKKVQKGLKEKGLLDLVNKTENLTDEEKAKRDMVIKGVMATLGGKLRNVLVGAAPVSKEALDGFKKLGLNVIQGYGLTETSPVVCLETDKFKRLGSVGIKLRNVDVKINNPNEDGLGELLVKGPMVMKGYYENEKATKEAFTEDGWFKTGDLAIIDDEGVIYIKGREKNVIVLKNGKNIFPEEIEILINKLPYVKESMVYGKETTVGDDYRLCVKVVYDKEWVKAHIFENSDNIEEDVILEEVKKEVKEINKSLPAYKHIRGVVVSEKELAKTTTSKIKRYEEMKNL